LLDRRAAGIHIPLRKPYILRMETIFDELTAAITAKPYDWRPLAVSLVAQALAGLAFGLGFMAAVAFAG